MTALVSGAFCETGCDKMLPGSLIIQEDVFKIFLLLASAIKRNI